MIENKEAMKRLADNLWLYFEKKLDAKLKDEVKYYKAEVATVPNNGEIGVKRPFDDTTIHVKTAASAENLAVGDQCLVVVFGSHSNAFAIGSADLSDIGGGGGTGSGDMLKSVYDPQNKRTDIFAYVDDEIGEAISASY